MNEENKARPRGTADGQETTSERTLAFSRTWPREKECPTTTQYLGRNATHSVEWQPFARIDRDPQETGIVFATVSCNLRG